MIEVPEAFAASTIAREGAAGKAWIKALPLKVAHLYDLWSVRPTGIPWHGYLGVVIPVTRDGVDLALKVSWIDQSSEHEPLALRAWDGRGAVRMVASREESGAMLLERLDADRSLEDVPPDEAAEIAATLLRRLSIPAPPQLRTVVEEIADYSASVEARWEELGRPISRRLLDQTLESGESPGREANSVIVNQDLHYGNVLRGAREPWLVIDPKPLAGDAEFGVAPLLWTRFADLSGRADLGRRLQIVTEAAQLDLELVRRWTVLRVVDYWLWALKEGFTEDPKKCEALINWLE